MKPVEPVLLHTWPRTGAMKAWFGCLQPPFKNMAALSSQGGLRITSRWQPSSIDKIRILLGGSVYIQLQSLAQPQLNVRTDEPGEWEI